MKTLYACTAALALSATLVSAQPASTATPSTATQGEQPRSMRPHHPQVDTAALAQELGVPQERLESLLSIPPHILQAAQQLGIDPQTLAEALEPQAMRERGRQLARQEVAAELGVSAQALEDALTPERPGLQALATTLGVSVERLEQAMPTPPREGRGGRGRGGMARGERGMLPQAMGGMKRGRR